MSIIKKRVKVYPKKQYKLNIGGYYYKLITLYNNDTIMYYQEKDEYSFILDVDDTLISNQIIYDEHKHPFSRVYLTKKYYDIMFVEDKFELSEDLFKI